MSTVSITAFDVSARTRVSGTARTAAPATRLRLTRRGRRVLAAMAATPIAVALGLAIVSGGSALASREDGAPAGTFDTVTVMPGESLWAIAEEVAPNSDPRDVVDAIISLNQLSSSAVMAGERLSIPSGYSHAD